MSEKEARSETVGQPSKGSLQIASVQLERFKAAFKPQPVKLGRFNLIVGRNGSGKSTLLEALQWLDTTMRHDARVACERYFGIHDLVNFRSRVRPPHFRLTIVWRSVNGQEAESPPELEYSLKVEEHEDGVTPVIMDERLSARNNSTREPLISEGDVPGTRTIYPSDPSRMSSFDEPDRLALSRGPRMTRDPILSEEEPFGQLRNFWSRAVFLRLSPNRLAQGSPPRRRSFDPLLDEEGQNLPALLAELNGRQREELIVSIRSILPDMRSVDVSRQAGGRDERVHYWLREKMPYRGRVGRYEVPVPAWMLSEGTRRITAILALLHHVPGPSLLCIEEIENGLDPWTVVKILGHLRSAADRGVQVVLSTHSPWLLDHVAVGDVLDVQRSEGETIYKRLKEIKAAKKYADMVPPGTIFVNEGAE